MAALPSLVVFGPQSKKPKVQTLSQLRSFLRQDAVLRPVVDAISDLPKLWYFFSAKDPRVSQLDPGIQGLQALSEWMVTGEISVLLESAASIVALPLLVIIHVFQYFQLLRKASTTHDDLLQATKNGAGIQGFCTGFLMAIVTSCSSNERHLASQVCNAIRLAVGIGIYSDLGVVGESNEQVTMVVRLKDRNQAYEIAESCPNINIAAIIDMHTITITSPVSALASLKAFTTLHGLTTQPMHLSGRVHNPENADLAAVLQNCCRQNEELMVEDTSRIQMKVRSNASGRLMQGESMTDQVINAILTSSCQWHDIMTTAAQELRDTGRQSHKIVVLGLADCVPSRPFHDLGLDITKIMGEEPAEILNLPGSPPEVLTQFQSVEPIAVVGMACRAPDADNVEELWDIISSGKSTAVELPKTRIDIHSGYRASQDAKWIENRKFYGNFMSDIDTFDHAFFSMSSREALALDPQQRLLLETTYEAVESSGYLPNHHREDGDNVGVFIGASFVDYEEQSSTHPPSAYTSTGTIRAFLCGRLSYYFGWSGPSEVIDTACSSSLVAVNRACKTLQSGECSMAIAGGVNLMTTATEFLNLGKAGFLSPSGQCKPFDRAADGYCRGEGAGVVVLKRFTQAQRSHDNILAVIPGVATNQGGLSASITIPHSPSQVALYKEVLRQSNIPPSQISYIETHGTGTQAGDPLEVESIRQVFAAETKSHTVEIGSLKANIGHLETAAGVMSLIKGILMLNKRMLPLLANFGTLNPKIPDLAKDRMAVPTSTHEWVRRFRAMLVNSYGAAGSNAALVLCQAPEIAKISTSESPQDITFPLIIEAQSKQGVQRYAEVLKRHLTTLGNHWQMGDLAFSLARRRKTHRFIWTSASSTSHDLVSSLNLKEEDISERPKESKNLVLAFPGQSRRNIGCDKSLFDSFHMFRSTLHRCDREIVALGFPTIFPSLFDTNPITDVVVLHSGTFALQYAYAESWMACGLKVDAVVGHSFGELTAMAVSGVLSLQDALKFITSRAAIMKKQWGEKNGSMVAIHASVEDVTRLINSVSVNDEPLTIACYNSEGSQVVSGSEASVDRLIFSISSDIKFQKLDVNYGFHSFLCDDILEDLAAVARSLNFHRPRVLLECCTEETTDIISPPRLVQHTREPVFFNCAIKRLETKLGRCVWLDGGLASSIIPMVKRATSDSADHHFQVLTLRSGQDSTSQLSDITVQLWRQGFSPTHWSFHSPQENDIRPMWLPPYQFERTKHWLPYIDRTMETLENQRSPNIRDFGSQQASTPVTLVAPSDSKGRYKINMTCQYYQALVSGHSVLRHPLCPASMYMECAAIAAQISHGSTQGKTLWFKDLTIDAPLGIDTARDAFLDMEQQNERPEWTFSVTSSPKGDQKLKATSHGKGRFGFQQPEDNQDAQTNHYERLVKDRIRSIQAASSAEILKSSRIYGIFSRIVDYGTVLKGMSSITIVGGEAVAEVETPPNISGQASSVGSICDSATLDNVIQVAGVMLNTSDDCDTEEAFLAVGIKDISISASSNLAGSRCWTVYASYTGIDDSRACADVAVLSKDHTLAATVNGINFAKLPFKRLHKLLASANEGHDETTTKSEADIALSRDSAASSGTETVSPSDKSANIDGRLTTLLASVLDVSDGIIPPDVTMGELGLDSLAEAELTDTLQSDFQLGNDFSDLSEMTYKNLRRITCANTDEKLPTPGSSKSTTSGGKDEYRSTDESSLEQSVSSSLTSNIQSTEKDAGHEAIDPVTILERSSSIFHKFASQRGFSGYWSVVAPKQDELMLAYIAEAFKTLGVDLWAMKPKEYAPSLQIITKHHQLVRRLWQILQRLRIVDLKDSVVIRTAQTISLTPAAVLLRELVDRFPAYAGEFWLMDITGSKLAECLSGKADATKLLFAGTRAQEVLGDYYTHSPQLACSTDVLIDALGKIVSTARIGKRLNILEVGGGFGGTTMLLVELLGSVDCQISYTFSDISPKLVKAAKGRFSKYTWMDFQTLNLEEDPLPSMQGKYDIVLGTNVVHATSDIVKVCSRIKSLLLDGGIMALSEVTRKVDWYDIVFGLLEGWWSFKDGRDYPLQPTEYWLQCLKDAGLNDCAVSGGSSAEARTQSIILGCKVPEPSRSNNCQQAKASIEIISEKPSQQISSTSEQTINRRKVEAENPRDLEVLTTPYKTVGAISILADIFLPHSREMINAKPIALMIHGGGHMTLSRKEVRPWQTAQLLDRGLLPVSLDYRLCPEINLIDGAMTDLCDGLAWARDELPTIARSADVLVDPSKVVVVGWSTGATLAMSLAWTTRAARIEPPSAILAFYGPSDYEAKVWKEPRSGGYPQPEMAMQEIQSHLFAEPISYYNPPRKDVGLGGLAPGDPRSELVFATFHSNNQPKILLQGFKANDNGNTDSEEDPSPSQIARISPLAQIRAGNYRVPTFFLHGTEDDVVPASQSIDVEAALREQGVPSEVLILEGKKHLFDLYLKPRTEEYDWCVQPGYDFLAKWI